MSSFSATIDNNIGSDAEYRAWCQSFEAALLASGFLEVAPDTGQLDMTTMTTPVANTYGGYRIYRAKDSVAAQWPYYIKLEYGLAAGAIAGVMVRRTLGTFSNGAGTLTGPSSSTSVIVGPTATGAGSQLVVGAGGTHSAWVYLLDSTVSTHQSFFMVGRLLDRNDGSAPDPLLFELWTPTLTQTIGTFNYCEGNYSGWLQPGSGLRTIFPLVADAIHNGSSGGNSQVYEGLIYRNGRARALPFVVGRPADLPWTTPGASAFGLNIWGDFHTFLPIPQAAVDGAIVERLAVLWE